MMTVWKMGLLHLSHNFCLILLIYWSIKQWGAPWEVDFKDCFNHPPASQVIEHQKFLSKRRFLTFLWPLFLSEERMWGVHKSSEYTSLHPLLCCYWHWTSMKKGLCVGNTRNLTAFTIALFFSSTLLKIFYSSFEELIIIFLILCIISSSQANYTINDMFCWVCISFVHISK